MPRHVHATTTENEHGEGGEGTERGEVSRWEGGQVGRRVRRGWLPMWDKG